MHKSFSQELQERDPHPHSNSFFGLLLTADDSEAQSYLVPFLMLLSFYCGWVLSLPLFPTQDGAMHLYYVGVLHHLLASGHSLFQDFYSIRHPLPPYLLQYGILLGLTSVLDPAAAEKCMACLILISTAVGFRSLATSIGPSGRLLSLWVFPLALSWPLFMGFHNFCLSVSFVLWGLGFWFRFFRTRQPKFAWAFLGSIAFVTITHPIPLLFLAGVAGLSVVARVAMRVDHNGWKAALAQDRTIAGLAAASFLPLLYVALFLRDPSRERPPSTPYLLPHFADLVHLQFMSIASGNVVTKVHRLGLWLLLVSALGVGWGVVNQSFRRKRVNATAVLWVSAVVLLCAIPLLPSKINGLEYFAERMPMVAWLLALAGASGASIVGQWRRGVAGLAIVFAILTLAMANHFVRPVARELSEVELPTGPLHTALLFDAPITLQHANLSFNPYFRWNGVRLVEHAGAVLVDDPWAGPPNILPIDRVRNSETAPFRQADFQFPERLLQKLLESPSERAELLSRVDFVVFVGKPDPKDVDVLLAADVQRHWSCAAASWYFACKPNEQSPERTPAVSLTSFSQREPADLHKLFTHPTYLPRVR